MNDTNAAPLSRLLIWLKLRLDKYSPWIIFWFILASVFTMMYLIIIGQRDLYVPDSRYYYARALWFTGLSHEDSFQELSLTYPEAWGAVVPVDQLFGWDLVRPRLIYPAFAAPFVAIWGLQGMAIASLVIAVAFYATAAWALARRYGRQIAMAVMVLILTSHYVMWFNIAMLTEAMSALWTTLTVIFAAAYLKSPKRRWLVLIASTVVMAAFTRQAILIAAGAFAVAWLGSMLKEKKLKTTIWVPSLTVIVSSAAMQLVHLVAFPSFSQVRQYLRMTGTESVPDAIRATPRLIARMIKSDYTNYSTRDAVFLAFLLIAIIGVIFCIKSIEAHLLIGAFLATSLYQITNGNATQFRYAIPGLIFYLLLVARTFETVKERTSEKQLARIDV